MLIDILTSGNKVDKWTVLLIDACNHWQVCYFINSWLYMFFFSWKLARMRKDLENVQMEENVQMMILCSSICAIPTLPLSRSVTAVRP